MVIINFYKKYNTSWDQLQKKALASLDEFELSAIEEQDGFADSAQEFKDYREAVGLGLKTFIIHVVNDWGAVEDEVLVFSEVFFKKFTELMLDGNLPDTKIPHIFKGREEIFQILGKSKIVLKPEELDFICEAFDSKDVIATIIDIPYEIVEISEHQEFEGKQIPKDLLKDSLEDSDEDDDDFDDIY